MPEPLIKTCGLSTPEAVDAAVAARATHIGLVHYPPSPRHVTLEQAAALRARVPREVKVVLLLVNEQPQPTALAIWKAIGVRETANLERAQRYKGAAHRILYDAPAQKLPGGTGLAFDWSLLTSFKHTVPWGLAGGLTPETVAGAIRATGAELVDASSGLESAPGVKDVDKIAAFCQAARNL